MSGKKGCRVIEAESWGEKSVNGKKREAICVVSDSYSRDREMELSPSLRFLSTISQCPPREGKCKWVRQSEEHSVLWNIHSRCP